MVDVINEKKISSNKLLLYYLMRQAVGKNTDKQTNTFPTIFIHLHCILNRPEISAFSNSTHTLTIIKIRNFEHPKKSTINSSTVWNTFAAAFNNNNNNTLSQSHTLRHTQRHPTYNTGPTTAHVSELVQRSK